jgi:aspartyl protease family protein
MRRALIAVLALAAAAAASAQTVAYNGRLGDKALLVIDGQPRTVATGASIGGVRLVSLGEDSAVVEVDGKRAVLRLGGTQANLAGGGVAGGGGNGRIVVPADPLGHFSPRGAINGRATTFLVDTGASAVAMSRGEAERLGVDWKSGRPGLTGTANGSVEVHVVTLAQVRVGEVTVYEVPAIVVPAAMPYVLLGNSFLNRFQMRRDNDVLTLERRY